MPEHAHSLALLLSRPSPLSPPVFVANNQNLSFLQNETRILIVGAGGLGCELLACCALSGFSDLHVIDLDKVDVSNLNRQFLFRPKDVGRFKAEVAAELLKKRFPFVKIKAHTCSIQSLKPNFYKQFNLVLAGLDNVEARQWLNETLVNLTTFNFQKEINYDSLIPLIDGGTEAFNGQVRLFLPRITSCFECSLVSMQHPQGYAICTIRNVPRLPEHCIVYALKVMWPLLSQFKNCKEYEIEESEEKFKEKNCIGVELDKDNAEHMTWIYERAQERAERFGISGVTYSLTMQVVKNIIPAISSTNALIAAQQVSEAVKYLSKASWNLNNYFMYQGAQTMGINTETFEYQRNPNCAVCATPHILELNDSQLTIQQLRDLMEKEYQMRNTSIATATGESIYIKNLHPIYENNLKKTVSEFLNNDNFNILVVNDGQKTKKVTIPVEIDEEMEE